MQIQKNNFLLSVKTEIKESLLAKKEKSGCYRIKEKRGI
jgi:hypothetical protein